MFDDGELGESTIAQSPAELPELTVDIPADWDRVYVSGRVMLVDVGEPTSTVRLMRDDRAVLQSVYAWQPAFKVQEGRVEGWLGGAPGDRLQLRLEVDGGWTLDRQVPAILRVTEFPPPAP